jgi:hypothetical protein
MFDNITWSTNENLTDNKLKRMFNNDRANYRKALLAPTGLLASGFINNANIISATTSVPIQSGGDAGIQIVLGGFSVVNKHYIPSDMTRFYQINIGQALIRLDKTSEGNWPNYHNIDIRFEITNMIADPVNITKTLTFRSTVGPRRAVNSSSNFSWADNQTSKTPMNYRTSVGQLFFTSSIFNNAAPTNKNEFLVEIFAIRRSDPAASEDGRAIINFADNYFSHLDAAFPITIEDIGGDANYAGLP